LAIRSPAATIAGMVQGVARGLALFIGSLAACNAVWAVRLPGFDPNVWWLFSALFLAAAGALLLAYALRPVASDTRRTATLLMVAILLIAATMNAISFHLAVFRGDFQAGVPLPLSWAIAAALLMVLLALLRPRPPRRRDLPLAGLACLAATLLFPLAQMVCFGYSDYRRKADAAVVFGARAYADGRLSHALADRVRTAVELYHSGLVPRLIFSGGPGDGDIHEVEAMRNFALSLGVPEDAILLDETGLNTDATVRATVDLMAEHRISSLLAVSHFYHLPRIKLTFQGRGVDVRTVPCTESYMLTAMPWYMAREVAALWVYYLRSVIG
jgi:uncharacterized SAM-binding protein YcdF (DUF218 family)